MPDAQACLRPLTVRCSVEPGPDPTSQHLPGATRCTFVAEHLELQVHTGGQSLPTAWVGIKILTAD